MSDSDALLKNVPPHSTEAERAVLGALLIDASAIDDVATLVLPEQFYKPAHAQIYTTILDLWRQDKPVDVVLLNEELGRMGVLEQVGGTAALASLNEAVPTAANAPYYAKIVRDHATRRALIKVTAEVQRDAFDTATTTDEILDRSEKRLFEVTQKRIRSEAVPVGIVVQEAFKRLEMQRSGQGVVGLPTGFVDVDELTQGFQPGEMTILAARPSMGKCLAFDSEIVVEGGQVVTIEELVRRRAARLFTLGPDLRLQATDATGFLDDGLKPTFRVTTRLGRVVETTLTHPFLTIDGWRPLGELSVGDTIGVPRQLPVFGARRMRPCEVKLLGYLIGDGGLTRACPHFTNNDARVSADFVEAVEQFGGLVAHRTGGADRAASWRVASDPRALGEERRAFAGRLRDAISRCGRTARAIALEVGVTPASITHWTQGATAPAPAVLGRLCEAVGVLLADLVPGGADSIRRSSKNALTRWLGDHGLMGHGAATKSIPTAVFELDRPQLALFLNRLLATDGWVSTLAAGQVQVGYASVSERLARQVQHLLLRFGVISSLRHRAVLYRGERRPAWQLDVTDARAIAVVLGEIGVFGKEKAVARATRALTGKRYQTNRDLIPVGIWNRIRQRKGPESWSSVARRAGFAGASNIHVGKRAPTRERLLGLATALADRDLEALATSDVTWDPIVSIEPQGLKRVFDLEVAGTHNFVANDVCVHNTSLALNFLRNVTVYQGRAAAFFSLEMPRLQVTSNLLCSLAKIDGHRLRGGSLSRDEERQFLDAAEVLSPAPLYIDDTPGLSTMELRGKVRRLRAQHNVEYVVIDYLQLMSGSDKSANESRQMEVSEISRMIKALARELSIPIMALAQLSRKVEERKDHKPMMSDLRESGSIEQDADVIMLLFRPEYYEPDKEELKNRAVVTVAKNRNGPVGEVNLGFFNSHMRFESLTNM